MLRFILDYLIPTPPVELPAEQAPKEPVIQYRRVILPTPHQYTQPYEEIAPSLNPDWCRRGHDWVLVVPFSINDIECFRCGLHLKKDSL